MDDISRFLESYKIAVVESDIDKISSHFHDEFVITTPTELWHITNNDEFRLNLERAFKSYKALGAQECKGLSVDFIDFHSNHSIANIRWGLLDDKQNLLTEFVISYCIKQMTRGWKFIFVIDHNSADKMKILKQKMNVT